MWNKKLSSPLVFLSVCLLVSVCLCLCLSLSVSVSVCVCVSRCLAVPVTREGENHSVPHYVAKRGNKCILTSRKMASKSPSAESKSE
jgi:hypothetical protein